MRQLKSFISNFNFRPFKCFFFLFIFIFTICSNLSSQNKTDFNINKGHILRYQVNYGKNAYDFIIKINNLEKEIEFDWGMSNNFNRHGKIIMLPTAIQYAAEQHNNFTRGSDTLQNKTTIWISAGVFDEIKKSGNCEIKPLFKKEKIFFKRNELFTIKYFGKELKLPVLYCETDQEHTFWILDDKRYPIILKMSLNIDISLKEILSYDEIAKALTSKNIDIKKIENYGDILFALGYYNKAKDFFRTCIENTDLINDKITSRENIIKIAECYKQDEDFFEKIVGKDNKKFYLEELTFKISKIVQKNSDSCFLLINFGTKDGLMKNSQGEIFGIYRKEFPNRGGKSIGSVRIKEIDRKSCLAFVTRFDSLDCNSIRKGDLISFSIKIPEKKFRSILFYLAKFNIEFSNAEGKAFYHLFELLDMDSETLENAILSAMADQVKNTAVELKNYTKDNPKYLEIIPEGLFAGYSLIEAMEKSTPKNILSFLKFVRNFPGKYIGNNLRLDEAYATWIINNTPISEDELLDSLLIAKDFSTFKILVENYKKDIIEGNFLQNWNSRAERKAKKNEFTEAYKINDVCKQVSSLLKNSNLQAWAIFSFANILDAEEKYEQSIHNYNIAKRIFKETNDLKGESYSYNNIGLKLTELLKYSEALISFDEALKLKIIRLNNDRSALIKEEIGNTFVGKAFCLFRLSRYKESLENYNEAKRYYKEAGTNTSLQQIAGIYMKIGDIYEKLNDPDNALAFNHKSLNLYIELGDKEGEANALNNLGYRYFKTSDYNKAISFYEQSYKISFETDKKKNAAFSKSNIGQMYWNLGKFDSAIKSHEDAIKLREESKDKSGMAYSWSKLGGLYDKSGNPVKALESYNQALSLYKLLNDRSGIASIYINIGDLYSNVKDFNKSIENYIISLKIREDLNTRDEIAETLYKIGNVYYENKNFRDAKENYLKSLKIYKEVGDKTGQLNCLSNLGLISQFSENNFKDSEDYFNNALKLAYETDCKTDIAYCQRKIAKLHETKGNLDTALELNKQSLDIYREINDKPGESSALIDLGSIFLSKGKFDTALKYYNESFIIAENSKNRTNMAVALNAIGEINSLTGEYQKSIEAHIKSLDIFKEVNNNWGIAGVNVSLGNSYNGIGEYQKAISYYITADSIYKIIGNDFDRATPINNIGTIFFWQGDYDRALSEFLTALSILKKINYTGEFLSIIKSNIGEIFYEKNEYPESIKWIEESITLARKAGNNRIYASSLTIMGKISIAQNDFTKAGQYLREAYQLTTQMNEKDRIAEISSLIGKIYHHFKTNDSAVKYLNESINISKNIGSNRFLWESLFTMALIHKEKNEIEKSIEYLKESVRVMEEIRSKITGGQSARKLFSKGELKVKIYETLVSLLILNNDINSALEYLERSNNDRLKEQFGKLNIKFFNSNKTDALEKEKQLKIKLDGLTTQITKEKSAPEGKSNSDKILALERGKSIAENEYTKFINETIKTQPDLANHFRKNVNPLEFRKVKRQIPNDVAVLAYLIGENQVYIFVATKDTVTAKVIDIKKSDLEMKINLLYNILKNPLASNSMDIKTLQPEVNGVKTDYNSQIRSFKKISSELFNILISPVSAQIEMKEKLAIIPNGELYFIPFQSLGTIQTDNSIRFLGSEKKIFYISSLNIFFSQNSIKAENLKILAFGNADNSLPGAELEVKDIQKLYPDTKVYIRESATKDKVINLPIGYNSIHLATHGNLDYGNFQNSYLTFAPNGTTGEDGKLTLEEIWRITNLYDYRMVTLSACNTGIGEEMIQGWLVNPANAFLDAGVQTVIATLWQVNDESTSILMKEFYNNLKVMNKIDALFKAQQILMNNPKYVDPYYWAPFILVGDWR